jgi:hypothetical protein
MSDPTGSKGHPRSWLAYELIDIEYGYKKLGSCVEESIEGKRTI